MRVEKNQTGDAPDLQTLRIQADKRKGGLKTVLGLLVAPLMMGATWLLTRDAAAVRVVGYWIFCVSSVFTVIGYLGYSKYSDLIKPFSQQHFVKIPGLMGSVNQSYQTTYDFSKFTVVEYAHHKKMHAFGSAFLINVFITISQVFTSGFFSQYIWK